MLARLQSFLLQGIDALPCEVEVDLNEFASTRQRDAVVGLPDAGIKEAIDRVRSALVNSGYAAPSGFFLINLAPADVRKEGPVYDLAIAVGVLITQGVIPAAPRLDHTGPDHRKVLIAGELALDGRVRPIKGVIALAALAKARGARGVIVPADNAEEAAVVEGLEVLGVRTLAEVVGLLRGEIEPTPAPTPDVSGLLRAAAVAVDFADVRGQEAVKRAITVAAAGSHNLFRLWSSGCHGGGLTFSPFRRGNWARSTAGRRFNLSYLVEVHLEQCCVTTSAWGWFLAPASDCFFDEHPINRLHLRARSGVPNALSTASPPGRDKVPRQRHRVAAWERILRLLGNGDLDRVWAGCGRP